MSAGKCGSVSVSYTHLDVYKRQLLYNCQFYDIWNLQLKHVCTMSLKNDYLLPALL